MLGLPYRTQWQDLKDLCRQAGNVLRADIMTNADGSSKVGQERGGACAALFLLLLDCSTRAALCQPLSLSLQRRANNGD